MPLCDSVTEGGGKQFGSILPPPRDGMNSIPQERNVGNQRSRERQQEGTENQMTLMKGMKDLVKTSQPGRETTGVCDRSLQRP